MTNTIRVRAHAKINLNLRVLERRPDGYHELRTVFQALDLHDTLTLVARQGPLVLESDNAQLPRDRTNLVWRAAELLWRTLGRGGEPRDVAVTVQKRIPMKAGLGGGSADGAAALLGFARLWGADMAATDLVALGGELGADVPFFFTGGAALGLGRGDRIHPLEDLPPLGVLVVVPPFDVSTADAFRWVDEQRGQAVRAREGGETGPPALIPGCPWPPPACEIANDFEPVIAARHPEIGTIVGTLLDNGAQGAALTGSGSAVFGLFEREESLAHAAAAMAAGGYAASATRTLSRREYLQSSAPVGA